MKKCLLILAFVMLMLSCDIGPTYLSYSELESEFHLVQRELSETESELNEKEEELAEKNELIEELQEKVYELEDIIERAKRACYYWSEDAYVALRVLNEY